MIEQILNFRALTNAASRQMEKDYNFLIRWIEDAEVGGVDAESLSQLKAYFQ